MSLWSPPKRVPIVRLLSVLTGVLFVSALLPAPASAATVTNLPQSWGTNGRILAVVSDPVNERVYLAGNFTAVTDASGGNPMPIANVAAFIPATGMFDTSWHPNPNGPVAALALSGNQLYLGGDFTQVGTATRKRLAAVDATTATLASWNPGANAKVRDLTVSGPSVYVGGNFTTLAGAARPYLGRVNKNDATLGQNWAPRPDAQVRSLVVSGDGSRVYVGGDFLAINGDSKTRSIASLSTTAPGNVTTGFVSGATNNGNKPPALDLSLDGPSLLAAVAGSGGGCASLNATTGTTLWSKHANGNMQAVTTLNGTAYCGGHFSGLDAFDGYTRHKLAAVDELTGVVQDFSPRINSALGVWSLGHDASRLYTGGDFTKVGRNLQAHFTAFG